MRTPCLFRALCFAGLVTLALPAGCTRTSKPAAPGTILKSEALTPEQQGLASRAVEARDALFQSLLAELGAALQERGPASAISVCRKRAPQLAEETSREKGLKIGRTSFRLRNPANAPPAWAKKLVKERVREPAYVALEDQGLGVFLPIVTSAPCLKCHGAKEAIGESVRKALAANYPSDTATGFEPGGLRGWFWIEVPRGVSKKK